MSDIENYLQKLKNLFALSMRLSAKTRDDNLVEHAIVHYRRQLIFHNKLTNMEDHLNVDEVSDKS